MRKIEDLRQELGEARERLTRGLFLPQATDETLHRLETALTLSVQAEPVLRRIRRERDSSDWLVLAAADPLNLAGILTPGGRVAAVAGHRVLYRGGVPVASAVAGRIDWLGELTSAEQMTARGLLQAAPRRSLPAAALRRLRR